MRTVLLPSRRSKSAAADSFFRAISLGAGADDGTVRTPATTLAGRCAGVGKGSPPSPCIPLIASPELVAEPFVSAPLVDSSKLRPVLHLQPRHKPILAILGLKNRCFALLHIEPVLAQGIDDVGLVRNEESVFALFGHVRQHLAKCRSSPAIFVG